MIILVDFDMCTSHSNFDLGGSSLSRILLLAISFSKWLVTGENNKIEDSLPQTDGSLLGFVLYLILYYDTFLFKKVNLIEDVPCSYKSL